MTIIVDPVETGLPLIGYKNLFDSATSITVTDETTGFEKENAYDWNLFDWWKPASSGTKYLTCTFATAVQADYFALFGHTLHTVGGSIQLQYSTDNITWNDATDPQSPSAGRVLMVSFAIQTAKYWRFKIIISAVCLFGVMAFGEALQLPEGMGIGFTPPTFARNNTYTDKTTVKGIYLPRSVERLAGMINIGQVYVDPVWMRDNWLDLLDHMEIKPFFFSWDINNHSGEAAYCLSIGDSKSSYSTPNFMSLNIKASAITELDV